jgi:hypothetical protein
MPTTFEYTLYTKHESIRHKLIEDAVDLGTHNTSACQEIFIGGDATMVTDKAATPSYF